MAERAVLRAAAVGVAIPVVACAASVAVQLAIMPDLPDPVATHWRADGPDGYSPPALVPWMTVLVAGVLPLIFGASALRSVRRGDRGFALALMPGVAAGLSVFMAILLGGSLVMQRGLASGMDAPDIDGLILGALLVGTAVGVLGWWVQPKGATARAELPAVDLGLHQSETAVWWGRARMTGVAFVAVVLSTVAVACAAVAAWIWVEASLAMLLTGVAVLLAVLLAMFTSFAVRADMHGLTVTSGGRIIRMTVPASDIAGAAPIVVSGIAQFGGYGIRHAPGVTAVVLRSGPALEVTRRSGRRFVVTVEDPAVPAALLMRLVGADDAAEG